MRARISSAGPVKKIDLKQKNLDGFGYVHVLEGMQENEDILGIGMTGKADFKIKSLTTKGAVISNDTAGQDGNVMNSDGSLIVGAGAGISMKETGILEIDGKEIDGVRVGIRIYSPGWVLNTGKTSCNIFGQRQPMYLKSIGRKNIKTSAVSGAHVFPNAKALLSYVGKHEDAIRYCVSQHGYEWKMEPTCQEFLEDWEEDVSHLTEKQAKKEKDTVQSAKEILEKANRDGDTDAADADIPETVTEADMPAEAVGRMKALGLWDKVIKRFAKDGTVFMSEFGGIIYDLDGGAKTAVDMVREAGNLPYHVVATDTAIGRLYSVLYVGRNAEEWKFERPSKKGLAVNFCYNAWDMLGEYGTSQFEQANGGLVRVA